jgi:hypothetical protein
LETGEPCTMRTVKREGSLRAVSGANALAGIAQRWLIQISDEVTAPKDDYVGDPGSERPRRVRLPAEAGGVPERGSKTTSRGGRRVRFF